MDPSAPAAQDVQHQPQADQQATPATHPAVQTAQSIASIAQGNKPAPSTPKTQISVSGGGGLESGSSVIVQEDADADEDDEDEIKVARQETKNQVVTGLGGDEQNNEQQVTSQVSVVDVAQEAPELRAAVPEVVVRSPEVEKIVEVTPPDQPKLTEEIKKLGVTHSGPGIIDVSDANIVPAKLPVTYEQALVEEEKIKTNKYHNSKYWLLEKIKYYWRKVNPDIEMTVKKQPVKKTLAVKAVQAKTTQVAVQTNQAAARTDLAPVSENIKTV